MCVNTWADSFSLASSAVSTHFSSSPMTSSSCLTVSFQVFVIIAAKFFDFLSFEVREIPAIPEHQMVGELADRVISFAVGPVGQAGGQAIHGGILGHEPFRVGVRGAQFRQQHLSQSGRFLDLTLKGRWDRRKNGGKSNSRKIGIRLIIRNSSQPLDVSGFWTASGATGEGGHGAEAGSEVVLDATFGLGPHAADPGFTCRTACVIPWSQFDTARWSGPRAPL